MSVRFLIVLFLFTNVWLPRSFAQNKTEDLLQIWHKVLKNNSQINEAMALAEAAKSESLALNSVFLPQAGLNGSWAKSVEKQDGVHKAWETKSYSFDVTQNIFDKAALNRRDIAQLDVEIANTKYQIIESKLIAEITQVYWKALTEQECIKALESELNGPMSALELEAKQSIEAGVRTPFDLSLYLTQIATLRLNLLRLRAQYDESLENLGLLAGEPINSLRMRKKSYEVTSLPTILKLIRPELKFENLLVEREKLNVQTVSSKFWPKLYLDGHYASEVSKMDQTLSPISHQSNTEIALKMSIPLFNGLSDFQSRKAAQSRLLAADQHRSALDTEIKTRALSSSKRLNQAKDLLDETARIWRSSVELEQSVLKRQEAGIASFDLIIGPKVQALEMTKTHIEAIFEYLEVLTREYAESGSLDEQSLALMQEQVLESE